MSSIQDGSTPLADDEIYLACLLAIGLWDMKVYQVEYLMAQLRVKLGREAETAENMAWVGGFIEYCKTKKD